MINVRVRAHRRSLQEIKAKGHRSIHRGVSPAFPYIQLVCFRRHLTRSFDRPTAPTQTLSNQTAGPVSKQTIVAMTQRGNYLHVSMTLGPYRRSECEPLSEIGDACLRIITSLAFSLASSQNHITVALRLKHSE